MLFNKPESYLLPDKQASPMRSDSYPMMRNTMKADMDAVKGASGDPSKAPTRFAEMMKQKEISVQQPRFVRDQMSVDDITGAKSRRLIRGVAKDILSN